MATYSFNSQVLSAFGSRPLNLSWSLSGGNNTVELLTVGSVSGKQVQGIAFNRLTTASTGSWATLSAADGTTFRVDRAYNGSQMAVIFTDESASLFTAVTGATTTKQTLTAPAFESSWPEVRRLVQLGYR